MKFVEKYLDPDPSRAIEIRDAINTGVRGAHKMIFKLWTTNYDPARWMEHPLVDPTGWREANFEIIDGAINENFNEPIAREFSGSAASDYWTDPTEALADISPFRTLLAVARGIRFPPTEELWVPLGVYRVRTVATAGSAEDAVQIRFASYSMEADIRDARFLDTPIAGTGTGRLGVNVLRDVLRKLVEDAFPNSTGSNFINWDINSEGLGLSYAFPNGAVLSDERNRLDLILAFLDDRDVWGRFDRANHFALDTAPLATDTAIPWQVDSGANGVLVSYSKEYNRDKVYNAVLAFGEYGGENSTPSFHISYLATDSDPESVTYWNGPYGRVPRFQRVGFLPNNTSLAAQIVRDAAQATLARAKEFKAGVSFDSVPNPLLEAGDVVEVGFPVGTPKPGESSTYFEKHLITKLTIGIGAERGISAETVVSGDDLPEETVKMLMI